MCANNSHLTTDIRISREFVSDKEFVATHKVLETIKHFFRSFPLKRIRRI